ncbi:MAG: hypothetical protein KDD70_03040 [Bdellovibrionales bacterium]|nr:hypothetical protein [Bdellovibrionales bacterium]
MARGGTNINRIRPIRIEPPKTFAPVLSKPVLGKILESPSAAPSRERHPSNRSALSDSSKESDSPRGTVSPRETVTSPDRGAFAGFELPHSFYGRSLHQGTLPFINVNGVHITFSPMLLMLFGVVSLCSALWISEFPYTAIPPLALLVIILLQLAFHLLLGWWTGSPAESLILSVTGVVDPGLIFRERSILPRERIYETEDGTYLKRLDEESYETADLSNEELRALRASATKNSPFSAIDQCKTGNQSEINDQSEIDPPELGQIGDVSKEIRYMLRAPLRLLGGSIGALLFISLASSAAISPLINREPHLADFIWWYAALLVVAPFLPPHRMNAHFKQQLTSSLYPLAFFVLLPVLFPASFASDAVANLIQPEAVFVFIVIAIARKVWWARVVALARTVQELSIEGAMIPIENLTVFSHGDSVASAQRKALQVPQDVFPVISGNRLIGLLDRSVLIRSSRSPSSNSFVPELAEHQVSLCDLHMNLEVCFSPRTQLPLFVIDDGEVVGMVTADSVRDALQLRLQEKYADEEDSDFEA